MSLFSSRPTGSRKTRWLVIGIGDISLRRVIPAIQQDPDSRLHAVLTSDRSKGKSFDCYVFTDADEALRDPDIDAVYIATPVALHAPQATVALLAGKHVLCEKPTALTYQSAVGMAATAEQAKRTLGVAYYRRFYPKILCAQKWISEGRIGQPVLAEFHCHSWFNGENGNGAWRLDPHLAGGGPLYDIACHRIDLLNFLFGIPARVTGHISNAVHSNPVEDNATVLVDYESGVRGVVDVRWHSKVNRDEFRIFGTEGSIDLTTLNEPRIQMGEHVEHLPPHENLHYPLIADFGQAIRENRPPGCPIESALLTDWVIGQVMNRAGELK